MVFADASGFTALTEALAKQPHGAARRREERFRRAVFGEVFGEVLEFLGRFWSFGGLVFSVFLMVFRWV